MWQTIILGFLGGLFGGNAFPHFAKGITKEPYPTVFGSSPVVNLVAGWLGLVIASLLTYGAHANSHPLAGLCSISAGVLLARLFHAWHGAIGK